MKAKIGIILAALLVPAVCLARQHNNKPAQMSDLRDAVGDKESAAGQLYQAAPESAIDAAESSTGGVVPVRVESTADAASQIEWVTIPGGKFMMGTDSDSIYLKDAQPIHEVAIKTFEMSKTPVTVEQYAECVSKGVCTEPKQLDWHSSLCNWGVKGRQRHPVNCLDWKQANDYARFKSARLPSEAEWEYAARSGGKNQKYPWGNGEPTCEKAVMSFTPPGENEWVYVPRSDGKSPYVHDTREVRGCGKGTTWPVCSKPAGNTAQGLCDMAGNVWEWVQDKSLDSYMGAPADGSAYEGWARREKETFRVIRGGAFELFDPVILRADNRHSADTDRREGGIGFRLARTRLAVGR